MKYLKVLFIAIYTLFRKAMPVWIFILTYLIDGLSLWNLSGFVWITVAFMTRSYSTNVVFNYILQHPDKVWLKRLYERTPTWNKFANDGWTLDGGRTEKGFIKYRKISWIEFQLVYWLLWGWHDNDSNQDTTDIGFIKTIISGERKHWLGSKFIPQLKKEVEYLENVKFGNAFELGDLRGDNPVNIHKCFLSTVIWGLLRNGAYNCKYYQFETVNTEDLFQFEIFGYQLGWYPEGIVADKQNYTLKLFEELEE